MNIGFMTLLFATLAQFVLSAIWYSLLFGKSWMRIMEAPAMSPEEFKRIQKGMRPFFALQFLLTFLFTFVLASALQNFDALRSGYNPYAIAFWIWIGLIAPTQISGIIWGNTKKKYWAQQTAIMVSCQLVCIMLATWILIA